MRPTARRVAALCALSLALATCTAPGRDESTSRLRVVATTSLLADLARNVAGPRACVEPLAPAGASIEDFAPAPDDARRVSEADLIFVNGLALDRWAQPLLRNAKPGAVVVVLSDGLPRLGIGQSENEDINKNGNPHYWFDIRYAKTYVERMRDALTAADSAGAATYAANAAAYLAQLDALDSEVRRKVAEVPAERRKLVTSHDAFPYFAAAYGLTVVGFVAPEPGKEPSPAELAELVEKVKAARVPAIFAEAALSPRLAQTLAAEVGVRTVVTDLVTDSLGPPPADTFIGLIRFDVGRIVEALR